MRLNLALVILDHYSSYVQLLELAANFTFEGERAERPGRMAASGGRTGHDVDIAVTHWSRRALVAAALLLAAPR